VKHATGPLSSRIRPDVSDDLISGQRAGTRQQQQEEFLTLFAFPLHAEDEPAANSDLKITKRSDFHNRKGRRVPDCLGLDPLTLIRDGTLTEYLSEEIASKSA
jgi:hypothetical protein